MEPVLGKYFQDRWGDSNFHPEVFYPKQFVTFFPWGECSETKVNDVVKIYQISHITHKRNVVEMESAGEDTLYCFQPKKKYGKSGYSGTNGLSYGESYRCDLTHIIPTTQTWYTRVNNRQQVLPDGCYAWWGNPRTSNSIYGSEKLTTCFKSALGTYQYGQTCKIDGNVFLRIGGTLRYKKKICYVIILHSEAQATAEIWNLPSLYECRDGDHFRLNGFVHEDGRVDWDAWTVPEFISRSYADGCSDCFAFAFYFSDCNKSHYLKKEK